MEKANEILNNMKLQKSPKKEGEEKHYESAPTTKRVTHDGDRNIKFQKFNVRESKYNYLEIEKEKYSR